ncbi:MAG TPA: adenylyl-sulfate kinase [Bacteroidales bacterium]|nr:adenylyl-sulfate kinase [Bacteroidota bacterium]HNQ59984.1 adenylyl-sulfate kinase [Bacteroidales bacterium]HNU21556.1 adenylyl-sulfate kinase [Bacteroidales bacterium]HNV17125.1 adenylyl-sulfate kinase [Bacteroidales bacterium]HNZ79933.1 adenylyl-sulfate kinase [Bacteroidales bacterium]
MMPNTQQNLFPSSSSERNKMESLLGQKSVVIWFTGLSGAGKTTLGRILRDELFSRGFIAQMLDGDNLRSGLNKDLGFSVEDRIENIRRAAEVSKLFMESGIISINCFITPTEAIRAMARNIIGKENLLEVFVDCPIDICQQRDTKGLYLKAKEGLINDFTGVNSPFEIPQYSDIHLFTHIMHPYRCLEVLMEYILPRITYHKTGK